MLRVTSVCFCFCTFSANCGVGGKSGPIASVLGMSMCILLTITNFTPAAHRPYNRMKWYSLKKKHTAKQNIHWFEQRNPSYWIEMYCENVIHPTNICLRDVFFSSSKCTTICSVWHLYMWFVQVYVPLSFVYNVSIISVFVVVIFCVFQLQISWHMGIA